MMLQRKCWCKCFLTFGTHFRGIILMRRFMFLQIRCCGKSLVTVTTFIFRAVIFEHVRYQCFFSIELVFWTPFPDIWTFRTFYYFLRMSFDMIGKPPSWCIVFFHPSTVFIKGDFRHDGEGEVNKYNQLFKTAYLDEINKLLTPKL